MKKFPPPFPFNTKEVSGGAGGAGGQYLTVERSVVEQGVLGAKI